MRTDRESVERLATVAEECAATLEGSGMSVRLAEHHKKTAATLRALLAENEALRGERDRWCFRRDAEKARAEAAEARILAALEPTPADPLADERVRGLVEEANHQTAARAQHWLRRHITAPEDAEVEVLCEKYGYGAVMDAASRLWARKPHGSGAFYIGGCIGFRSDEDARAALAALKGEG